MEDKKPEQKRRGAWELTKHLLGLAGPTGILRQLVHEKTQPGKRRKKPVQRTGAKGRRRARALRKRRRQMAKASRKKNRAA